MAWEGSNRKRRLPSNWSMLRVHVLKRDGYRCQFRDAGGFCVRAATEVDHIHRGDDHSPSNLQALCSYHHGKKSAQEGSDAARIARRKKASKFRRTEEKHPSLM